MAEPVDRKHRQLIDAAVREMAVRAPRDLVPSNNQLGEELARSVSRRKTRHQVVRLIASRHALEAGLDGAPGPAAVESTLKLHMERFAKEVADYRPEALPGAMGRLAEEYFDATVKDIAALSRWLLFCAIATTPGELEREDATDREEFRSTIASWISQHTERYQERYAALILALGRRDRQGDDFASFTQLAGMLSEGAFLRVAIDPTLDRVEARRMYRQAILGLVSIFSAPPTDDRDVDTLIFETLAPTASATGPL